MNDHLKLDLYRRVVLGCCNGLERLDCPPVYPRITRGIQDGLTLDASGESDV